MSRGVNKWIGIGNCCADPDVRHTKNGGAVTNITVACESSYKAKSSGETVVTTEYCKVVLFGRLAEIGEQYLRKGSRVYIEGRLQTRKWQGQDGQDRYTTEIVGNDMQMLDGRGDTPPDDARRPSAGSAPAAAAPASDLSGSQGFDDDIPF